MKRLALIASAALLASPLAFAQDADLCELNLSEVEQNMIGNRATLGEPAESRLQEYIDKAHEAHRAGNTQECVAHSTQALQLLKGPGSSTTGSAGSASGAGN